ncbi:MAG: hypothetical protein O7C01_00040 [Actinobacteria bacterium]|nr:hypothetical protein [Actinomycetota bacterium]
MQEISEWLTGRLPSDWFEGPPEVDVDSDEILVTGRLGETPPEDASEQEVDAARQTTIEAFRDNSRERRVEIAQEAERQFDRKLSWAARCGSVEVLFSHVTAPVTTRLGMKERRILDTVVDAGLASSHSSAMIWCIGMVGEHENDWSLPDLSSDVASGGPTDTALTGAISLRHLRSALTRKADG